MSNVQVQIQWGEEENRNRNTHTERRWRRIYSKYRNKCNKAPAFHWNEFHINWPFHSWIFGSVSLAFWPYAGSMVCSTFWATPRLQGKMRNRNRRRCIWSCSSFESFKSSKLAPRLSTEKSRSPWCGYGSWTQFLWDGTFYLLLTISSLFVLINFLLLARCCCKCLSGAEKIWLATRCSVAKRFELRFLATTPHFCEWNWEMAWNGRASKWNGMCCSQRKSAFFWVCFSIIALHFWKWSEWVPAVGQINALLAKPQPEEPWESPETA